MPKRQEQRIAEFAGLNDRDVPSHLTHVECPDLRNMDFSERSMRRRNGFTRVTTSPLRDASIRLNGQNQYIRIAHLSRYTPGLGSQIHFAIKLVMRERPNDDVTIISKGYGTGSNMQFRLFWDASLNSNGGGWSVEAYDGSALRTFAVSEPSGSSTSPIPVDTVRYIEFGWFPSQYELRVYDGVGASVGTDTLGGAMTAYGTGSQPLYLGVSQSAAETPGSDLALVTLAEFRMSIFATAVYTTGSPIAVGIAGAAIADRELDTPTELTTIVGYWKMNDGTGAEVADSYPTASDVNPGVIVSDSPAWYFDQADVLGNSGLRFFGGGLAGKFGWVHWKRTGTTSPLTVAFLGAFRRWAFEFIFTPLMDESESTVRDQIIFNMGTDTANPSFLRVAVVSDRIVARYRAGGVNYDTSVGTLPLLSTKVGQRLRVSIRKDHTNPAGTPLEGLVTVIREEDGTVTFGSVNVTPVAAPATPAAEWSIGALVTSYSFPFTFSGTAGQNPAYGILDDFRFIIGGLSGYGFGPNNEGNIAFLEVGQASPAVPGGWQVLTGLRLNEGAGTQLTTYGYANGFPNTGSSTSDNKFIATIQGSSGVDKGPVFWDHGLVEPYEPPEVTLLYDYRRFSQVDSAAIVRELLAISGCTLYSVNLLTGAATIRSGGLAKGGLWTAAQRGDVVYLACRNGLRPMRYGMGIISQVGIDPPNAAPEVTGTSGGGGSFSNGTHYLYVTYYNRNSNQESNPSPGKAYTFAGGGSTQQITNIDVPVSPDPQVTARRVWMTAAAQPDLSTSYLVATIDDNVQTSIAVSITSVNVNSTNIASGSYFDNGPAPQASCLALWNDYLFVAGNQDYPTRVFTSMAGRPESFSFSPLDPSAGDFLDLDNDSGDPVTALVPRLDVVAAYTRDGRWDIWATGLDDDPFDRRQTNNQGGAVGPQAVRENIRQHIYISERHVYVTDGYNDRSISSPPYSPPPNPNPSIEYTLRSNLSDARRQYASLAVHRSRDQLWLCLSSSSAPRNDIFLVYDVDRGTWTRYDLDCDLVTEVEDGNDSTWIYGAQRGHIIKLDTGTWDGFSSLSNGTHYGTATGGTTTSLTVSGTPYSGLTLKGHKLWVYDISGAVLGTATIRSNTSDTLNFYSTIGFTVASGDVFAIGVFPAWASFMVAAPRMQNKKRLRRMLLVGNSDNALNTVRVTIYPDETERTVTTTNKIEHMRTWPALIPDSGSTRPQRRLRMPGGGTATAFRVRVSEVPAGFSESTIADVVIPSPTGRIEVYELILEYVEADSR